MQKNCIEKSEINVDKNGHGTMCAYIIEKYSNCDIVFYSYKIFEERLEATETILCKALKLAYEDKLDFLNMSLSLHLTESKEIRNRIRELVDDGVVIVSAKSKTGKDTYFDKEKNVITVEGKAFENVKYEIKDIDRVACDNTPIIAKWYKNEYDIIGGTSKATALYTAILCRKYEGLAIEEIEKKIGKQYALSAKEKGRVFKYISKYTGKDIDYLKALNTWESLEGKFFDDLVMMIRDLLGEDILDEETIYYTQINSMEVFLKLMGNEVFYKCLDY